MAAKKSKRNDPKRKPRPSKTSKSEPPWKKAEAEDDDDDDEEEEDEDDDDEEEDLDDDERADQVLGRVADGRDDGAQDPAQDMPHRHATPGEPLGLGGSNVVLAELVHHQDRGQAGDLGHRSHG